MPITPNAPDYVGQVRGILNDLREDYARKQKLYLEELSENNRMELAYAQLAAQQQTANQQNALSRARSTFSDASSLAEMQKAQLAQGDKAAAQDLKEREFKWKQLQDLQKLEDEKRVRDQELEAGRIENEGRIALESDDPLKLVEWTNKLAGSILTTQQRNDVYKNAMTLVDTKRKLDQENKNIRTQPQGVQLVQQINMMDVSKYSPDGLSKELEKITNDFKGLGNTDPKLNDLFFNMSTQVATRHADYMKSNIGKEIASFENRARLGQLPQESQKAWDELHKDPRFQDEMVRNNSQDYSDSKRRLMFESNRKESIAQLKVLDAQNQAIVTNLLRQNPDLGATVKDPETGESFKTFPYPVPDLSPMVGHDAAIDPDTGRLTKSVQDRDKKWKDEITSPTFLIGQVPMMRQFMGGMAGAAPSAQAKDQANLPIRVQSPSQFAETPAPGTARIPVVPPSRVAVSPETVAKIEELYRTNPDGQFNGRSVRALYQRLKDEGYIPAQGVPATNTAVPGQTR
jgi:hypothetical protein